MQKIGETAEHRSFCMIFLFICIALLCSQRWGNYIVPYYIVNYYIKIY